MAKHPKTKTAPAEKRRPGRPRSSPLDPIEQARVRLQRHRESKRNAGMIPAEIWLPKAWRDAVIARGETLQDAAQEAFRLLMGTLGVQPRVLNVNNRVCLWEMKKLDPLEATRECYSPICSKEHGAAIFPQTVYLPMSAPGAQSRGPI